jgi:6-pyruvoyltetrahydropterin/6-carboxytetrahydropterin synthase
MAYYRMTVETSFSAAHRIRGHAGLCQQLHGHSYRVVAQLVGDELDALGMLVDYADVKRALAEAVGAFDHGYLNDLPEFAVLNPTSEVLAQVLYQRLGAALLATDDLRRRVRIAEVMVFESDRQGVAYTEG